MPMLTRARHQMHSLAKYQMHKVGLHQMHRHGRGSPDMLDKLKQVMLDKAKLVMLDKLKLVMLDKPKLVMLDKVRADTHRALLVKCPQDSLVKSHQVRSRPPRAMPIMDTITHHTLRSSPTLARSRERRRPRSQSLLALCSLLLPSSA